MNDEWKELERRVAQMIGFEGREALRGKINNVTRT